MAVPFAVWNWTLTEVDDGDDRVSGRAATVVPAWPSVTVMSPMAMAGVGTA